MSTVAKRGSSRVFLLEDRAGPSTVPSYLDIGAAGAISKTFGSVTRIEVPSSTKRGSFDVVDSFVSGEDNVTLPINLRYIFELSTMLRIARKGCEFDVQVHMGACSDPRDFANGWHSGKINVFEAGRLTDYSTSELGTLSDSDQGEINEDVEASFQEFYERGPITFAERATGEVGQNIIKVSVCDSVGCGDCDDPSDGCQKIFAVSAPAGTSPGLLPEVLVSTNGLTSIVQESPITSLAIGEDPDDAACVGDNYVVVSEDSASLHWAGLAELILGTETWAEVTSGFIATGEPRALISVSPVDTWIVGAGGHVYKSSDPTNGVSVQDEGIATTESLNGVDAYDLEKVVAVGDNNAVIYTTDSGNTWQSVTGPAVGVNLTATAMRSAKEWWVGDAGGNLWYTTDSGQTWAQKAFSGDGVGVVESIIWASDSMGFLSHTSATPSGRILSTISGGWQWAVMPDGNSALPANDGINSLAVCEQEVNILYAGGLADDGADGILMKGTSG